MATGLTIAVVSAFPPGMRTLNEYGFHFVRALADHPEVAHVTVLADVLESPKPEADLGAKISVQRVWSFNSAATPFRILAATRQLQPDGLIYNTQTAAFGDKELPAGLGLLTPALTKAFGYKSGVIAHNILGGLDLDTTILKGQRLRQLIVKAGGWAITKIMTRATYTTVTLQGYVDILNEQAPKADVSLVPHGAFETGERDWVDQAARPHRIVAMGKFGTYKRLETLFAAKEILRSDPEVPELEVCIGGSDHPNASGYLAQLEEAHASDPTIIFKGYIAENDVADFFETARLAIFDYGATTGSSGVLHQAASYGTVPVFPRIGDFVDLCRDEGLSGGNFAPGDAPELAQVIKDLLLDPAGATQTAKSNYDAVFDVPMSAVADWHVARLTGRAPALP